MKRLFGMFFSAYVTVVLVSLSRRKTSKVTHIKIIIVIHILYTYLQWQCSGSVTFLYGSGSADPYHGLTDPDPDPALL
jgi:hypothetical protein